VDPAPDSSPVNAERRWWLLLGLVCALGLTLRVAYVLLLRNTTAIGLSDAFQYHYGANLLVDGEGFVAAFPYFWQGSLVQTAQHPPLYTIALAIPSAVGLRTVLDHQLWSCVMGTGTVAVLGMVGRDIGGRRLGLIAASVAAVYPNLWVQDGLLAAETLAILTAALTLLAAYRLWTRRSFRAAVALGAACALAALTRAEAILFLPFTVVPILVFARDERARRRLALCGVAALVSLVVLAPWILYNRARFHQPSGTALDLALVQGNCDAAYYGSTVGYYSQTCIPASTPTGDETDADLYYRQVALRYVRANLARVPFVLLAREGRVWGYYHPLQQARVESYIQGRDLGVEWAGLGTYYLLVAGAAVGAVVGRRRRIPLSPALALFATVAMAVAVTWGETRYRSSAEPALVLLASLGADGALEASDLKAWSRGRWHGLPFSSKTRQ